jgi:dynein heavy chain
MGIFERHKLMFSF